MAAVVGPQGIVYSRELRSLGPLLLRHGATKLVNPATPGQEQWSYRLGRDRIPGFAVSGLPGPGRLDFRLR